MALKPLNSVGGFSVGEIPANVILANADITANKGTFVGNVAISNSNPAYGILTDNLYYSNGQPWDLQQAAGSNTQIQFNNNNDFGASANFTFDSSTNLLTVVGNVQFNNANLGNLVTSNFANIASNTITNNLTVNLDISGNTANFSGNVKALNANLGNLATANYANFTNDVVVQGNIANANNISVTNNLNAVIGNFSGNINSLNANLGNLARANFANIASNTITNNLTVNADVQANTANFSGNVNLTGTNWLTVANTANVGNLRTNNLLYANGVPWDLQEAAGANTEIQYNLNNNFSASANFTFDPSNNNLTVNGNILVGANAQNQIVPLSNTALEIRGGWNNASGAVVSLVAGDYANSSNWGKISILGNLSSNATAQLEANVMNFQPAGGGANIVKVATLAPAATSTTTGAIQVAGGIGVTGNGYFGGNVVVTGDIANANNISVTNNLNAVIGNFSGNINSLNANLGNLATANYVNVASNVTSSNLTVNLELAGNTANFSGNVVVPNLTVNLQLAGNTANFSGNVVAANLTGPLANGNSNVKVYSNSNVEVSVNGSANVATFTDTAFLVIGNIQTTAGNMLANGNITANGFLNSANANVTGEAKAGSLVTSNINYGGNITISAVGTDLNINLVPGGPNGVVDVSLARVAQVGDPTQPHDAATKEYVDNIAQGLSVHTAVNVTSASNLNATYTPGGTTQTTTTISGGKTITFSANHGLSVGDEIYWLASFNGIVANNGYFVYSIPALNQITIKDGFYGAEVTTLTNGTGLSQTSRANSGVGATLTNAGANAAIQIDGVSLSSTNRVLVQGQTNAFENGVYTVTTVGNGSTAWVLTRSSDTNTYDPKSTTALGYGDYFFVQQGLSYAGSSYVLTTPTGEIVFGVTNLGFTQFSAAGSYSAGSGINIIGTTISANVDGVTTDIISGNIAVKTGANLITPNIGDATFSSLTWNNLSNGNVTANNLSTANIANIGLDLTVGGNAQINGTLSSNANVSGLNITTTGNVQAGGNVLAANVTANSTVFASNANVSGTTITNTLTVNNAITGNTANFSGNVVVPNLTVNLELAGNTANFSGNTISNNITVNNVITGNTANFSGNVVVPNLTVNLALVGNTANFSGNVTAANANLGNLATANFFTGTLINGTSNVAIPSTNGNVNITAGGNTSFIVTSTGANVTGDLGVTGNFNVGNLVASNLTANTAVNIGNTAITWGTVTTTSITANQTISTISVTGITGVQWLVKGLDAGGKQSVATVQAVTDGTSVDWATFGGVQLGGTTGTLAVNISGGNIQLQVTPASSNSTVWVTQYRII